MGSIEQLVKNLRHERDEIKEEQRTIQLAAGFDDLPDADTQESLASEIQDLKLRLESLEQKLQPRGMSLIS
jgi:predicted  nucleic acid-binding Zn-ribbon protein